MRTFPRIDAIYCHEERCGKCENARPHFSCTRISSFDKTKQIPIVLLEKGKRQLHFWWESRRAPSGPPWYSDGWDSLYIADDNLINTIERIIGIRDTGAFVSIYYRQDKRIRVNSYPFVRSAIEYDLLSQMIRKRWDGQEWSVKRLNLSERIDKIAKVVADNLFENIPEMKTKTRDKLAEIVSHHSTVLCSLMPYVLDDCVEEIFMDMPGREIYFDHSHFGRVFTSVRFSDNQSRKLVTMLRRESNLHLDRRNPSLKADITILGIPLRFSVTIDPLAADGMSFEIRKARRSPFDIPSLIRNETISSEIAALLLLAINLRMNITITGRPGTGKTTLLNALDISTPEIWRKVYIEDIVESRLYEKHNQIRFSVSPLDESFGKEDKSTEILKTLHRSPDYLIMGEIQTSEHSRALFQAIAAGLPSIQTCHADSASSLLARWKYNHDIDDVSIALMDVIITMDRPVPGESKRQISEIVEIRRRLKDGILHFGGLHTIYSGADLSNEISFSKDGAFQSIVSKRHNYEWDLVLERLTLLIEDSKAEGFTDFDEISSRLWENGDPLLFAYK